MVPMKPKSVCRRIRFRLRRSVFLSCSDPQLTEGGPPNYVGQSAHSEFTRLKVNPIQKCPLNQRKKLPITMQQPTPKLAP